MPTKPSGQNILTGLDQALASLPLAATPQGGLDNPFSGTTGAPPKKKKRARRLDLNNPMIDPRLPDGDAATEPNGADPQEPTSETAPAPEPTNEFAGMGLWLNEPDSVLYKLADELVMRQEMLALNHLALDTHFARLKQGYAFSSLEKDESRGIYRSALPLGTNSSMIQAVPNKTWDLCNKATETVLVDFAQPLVTPSDNSQSARAAAKVAQRVLDENSGENGTNDIRLFFNALDRALVCSSSYIERWVDPVGGGSKPLQILAHPEATDPAEPMLGPDGMPTTDPVLRHLTAADGGKFTDNAMEAAPEWQPKLRATLWGREHIRVFPEQYPVDEAEKVIILGYCTIGEAKRRWPAVAQMTDAERTALLDWTPARFMVLLPPFQQARWRSSAGTEKEKQGSSDERILFYYHVYASSTPENKRGADVVLSGAAGGTVLNRQTLAAVLPGPPDGTGKPSEVLRCIDIPVTQLTPRADPDGRDPSGLSYIWLFSGAVEFDAALMTAFLEMVSLWVHPDSYQPSTSPVQADQVRESRMTGQPIPIMRPEDKPVYGNQPQLPNAFWQSIEHNASSIESIASMTKPLTGSDRQPEVSGKARQIAVQQAMVGLSRMQHPVNAARTRDARICLELAMRDFSTAQTVRFMGEDGSWQAQEWTGDDFAQVGGVQLRIGTGTMFAPEAKVNYLGNLQSASLISPEEARDAARSAYAPSLGLSDSPHTQYVERCIKVWLDGPPEGWLDAWSAHKQAIAQWEQQAKAAQQAQLQQEQQQEQQSMTSQTQQQLQAEQMRQQSEQQAKSAEQFASQAAEQRKQEQSLAAEDRKQQQSLELERERHRMTMETAAMEREYEMARQQEKTMDRSEDE